MYSDGYAKSSDNTDSDPAGRDTATLPPEFQFCNVAEALATNGYLPIPIPHGTKAPNVTNWRAFRVTQYNKRGFPGHGVGLLTGELVAIDVDVYNSDVANEIEKLARDRLGERTLVRYGQRPKRVLLYRTATPLKKKMTRGYALNALLSTAASKVELLGDGQQVVCFGIHPVTQRAYEWEHGASPLDYPLSSLPAVDEPTVDTFIAAAEALLAAHGTLVHKAKREPGGAATPGEIPWDIVDIAAYAERALEFEARCVAAEAADGHERNNTLNKAAFAMGTLAQWLDKANAERVLLAAAARCGLGSDEARKTFESGWEAGAANPRHQQATPDGATRSASGKRRRAAANDARNYSQPDDGTGVFEIKPLENSEADIARAFVFRNYERLRYCELWGAWLEWIGGCWRHDNKSRVFDLAREICVAKAATAGSTKLAASISSARTMAATLRIAKCAPRLATVPDDWDADPWLLNTPGGIVDLRTGQLHPHDPAVLCSKITAVAPSNAPAPVWEKFLRETTAGDAGLQRFLQQMAGYSLTGDVREHALFFVYGPGGNGKSVFLNAIAGMIGDYATTASMDAFTASQSDRHPTDLAMLQGARMVTASETDEGRAWAESKIKQMTGGDPITARFMRQDFFTYRPQFKLIIIGNHKPLLRNVDDAARRRFNIVPFVNKPLVPDRQLEAKLKAEWPAILSWAIQGCVDWQQTGLVRPACVADATSEYFEEQDSVSRWIEERCETGWATYCDTTAALFKSWADWAAAGGEKAGTSKWLAQTLQRLGYVQVRHTPGFRGQRGFTGVQVRRGQQDSWHDQ